MAGSSKIGGDWIFRRRFISQLFATEVVNILKILDGMYRGYLIYMILSPVLNPEEIGRKTEKKEIRLNDELLWISPLFSLLGVPLFGTLFIDRFGRRLSLVVVYLASLLSWILTLNKTDILHLYLGIGFAGIARCGASLVIPIFVTEICNPSIRGRLLAISTLNENIGIALGFFAAYYAKILILAIALIFLSVIFLVYLMFLRESPIYYYKRGNSAQGEISLKYYWNVKNYSNIRDSGEYVDYLDNIRRKWETGDYKYNIVGTSSSFRQSKSSPRNLLQAVAMGSLLVFTGTYTFMYYLGSFQTRDHNFRGDFTTTITAILIVAILGAKLSALLVDHIGRISTLKISGWGCVIALFITYLLDYVSFTFSMYEVDSFLMCSLVLVVFLANIGFTSVWSTVALELMNDEQRLYGFCLSNGLLFSLEVLITSSFPFLLQTIHFHGFIFIFLIGSVANLIIVKNYIPETQGKWLIN